MEDRIVKTPQQARQGRRTGLIYVLVAGLALVVIAFALTTIFHVW